MLIDRIEGDIEMIALDAYNYALMAASDAYEYAAFDSTTWQEDELAQQHIEAAAQNFKIWARKQAVAEYMKYVTNLINERSQP